MKSIDECQMLIRRSPESLMREKERERERKRETEREKEIKKQ